MHLIHKACQILLTFTKQCHCLHLHSQCLHLTPDIPILCTAIPHLSLLVPSIALDIQHCLTPFTVTSVEMHCHADMIHIDQMVHLHFLIYELEPTKIFSADDVSGQNFKYICSFFLCCVLVSLISWLTFMVFNLWIGPGFILSLVVTI